MNKIYSDDTKNENKAFFMKDDAAEESDFIAHDLTCKKSYDSDNNDILTRLRRLESYAEKSSGNEEEIIQKSKFKEDLGRYLLSKNDSDAEAIRKYLGVLNNGSSITASSEVVGGDYDIIRLADFCTKVAVPEGASLKICRFNTTQADQKAHALLNNSANDPAAISDPNSSIQNCELATLNYYNRILQAAVSTSNAHGTIVNFIIKQLIEKENDLIINSDGQNGMPLGLAGYLQAHNNLRQEVAQANWGANNANASAKLGHIYDLVSKVDISNKSECQFWMPYNTYKELMTTKEGNNYIFSDVPGNVNLNSCQLLGFKVNFVNIPLGQTAHKIWFLNPKNIIVGESDTKFYSDKDNKNGLLDIGIARGFSFGYNTENFISQLSVAA